MCDSILILSRKYLHLISKEGDLIIGAEADTTPQYNLYSQIWPPESSLLLISSLQKAFRPACLLGRVLLPLTTELIYPLA